MNINTASITSLLACYSRGYHAEHDSSVIFDDSLALKLLTAEEQENICEYLRQGISFFAPKWKDSFKDDDDMLSWIIQTQLSPTPLARARYCEDIVVNSIHTGTKQYVIFGAELDMFAYRHPEISVFELDHPATEKDKRDRLVRAGIEEPETVHYIPVDFSEAGAVYTAMELLNKARFDPAKKTMFSLCGVSSYNNRGSVYRAY